MQDATGSGIALRTRGLSRSFGKFKAVDGIDLEIRRGEIYGFLGKNGAGKTTTLRMLVGILRPDGGELELLGERIKKVRPAQKRRLGYVSQEHAFYPWMRADELGRFVAGFYPTWDPVEFERLLQVLDVPKDRKAAQLSGGTKMKLAVALALAHRPELLVLDEPTAGLDPVARREVLETLAQQCRTAGQTILFSSHLVGEIEQVAHRVGIIQDGKLRYQGDLDTLRRSVRRVVLPTPGADGAAPAARTAELPPAAVDAALAAAAAPPVAEVPSAAGPLSEQSPEPPAAVASSATAAAPSVAADPVAWLQSASDAEILRRQTDLTGREVAVVRASPEAWATAPVETEVLSLEEIFLALARRAPSA